MLGIFSKKIKKGEEKSELKNDILPAGGRPSSGGEVEQPFESLKEIKKISVGKGRKLQGVVVSDKMNKTVVVEITYLKLHSKYKKQITVTKRFKAHNENNNYHTGDKVIIQETRPISKEKRWIVVEKVKSS